MLDWSQLGSILDFCAMYFTVQLVPCAVFSFALAGAVMLFRKIWFQERIFGKGVLWALFLMTPCLGRLRLFYENEIAGNLTRWLMNSAKIGLWASRIYMAGVLAAAVCIFGKRICLRRAVAGMGKILLDNIRIRVTDMNVTPFAVGLLRPEIVMPKAMLDSYSRDEQRAVVQHERTHIRLGHLWYGFAWDILRCLLWVNPLLPFCQKYFRADMEDICDRVCIQNSGRTAHEYGFLLLKSLKLLRCGQEKIPPAAAYAGERDFSDIKRRMEKIAKFRPYRKGEGICVAIVTFMIIGAMLTVIHIHSYARCSERKDIMVYQYDGKTAVISGDTDDLSRMISYDDSFVYVDSEAFEIFLDKNNAAGEIYIVFGGYDKLPGIGSVAETCIYENNSREATVQIPYKSIRDNWDFILFKLL